MYLATGAVSMAASVFLLQKVIIYVSPPYTSRLFLRIIYLLFCAGKGGFSWKKIYCLIYGPLPRSFSSIWHWAAIIPSSLAWRQKICPIIYRKKPSCTGPAGLSAFVSSWLLPLSGCCRFPSSRPSVLSCWFSLALNSSEPMTTKIST